MLEGWWHPSAVVEKAAMCGWENTPFFTPFSQSCPLHTKTAGGSFETDTDMDGMEIRVSRSGS